MNTNQDKASPYRKASSNQNVNITTIDEAHNLTTWYNKITKKIHTQRRQQGNGFNLTSWANLDQPKEVYDVTIQNHKQIMQPQTELEGIFANLEHLGEIGNRVDKFTVNGKKALRGATGITNLDKIIYYECQTTAQGEPVVEHENRKPRNWYAYAGGIKKTFGCTTEQAETLALAFKVLDTTPKMAKQFKIWLTKDFTKSYLGLEKLASEMILCTDEGEERIITSTLVEETNLGEDNADNPNQEIELSSTVQYHKLDDARDELLDINPKTGKPTTWETAQPQAYQNLLNSVRQSKSLAELGVIGKSTFGVKTMTKDQSSVFWGIYKSRKHYLSPKLSPLTLKVLAKIAGGADLGKVANWLHNKPPIKPFESKVVWNAWHAMKKLKAPKQTTMELR